MRITADGRVTIPRWVRERYGLLPGTDVEFVVLGGRVTLQSRPSSGTDLGARAVSLLRGTATTGMSADEILALRR